MNPSAPAARLDAPFRGIAFVLLGASVFPLQDVVIKKLSDHYPVLQIVFIRGLVSVWALAFLAWWEGGPAGLSTTRPGLHAVRGALGVVSFTSYYMAIAALPLAEVVAVSFASPLFVTALSALVLGEPVGARHWTAVLVGFAGVLVVVRPGTAVFEPAALLVVVSALFYAVSQTITRHLGRTDSAATIALSSTLLSLPVAAVGGLIAGRLAPDGVLHPSLAFLLRAWVRPGWGELALLALCGVIAGVGAYSLAQGYRAAPARTVAPFEYVMILWAVLWGYVFWGSVPGGATLLGVAMTVGAGLWVVHHQAGIERERRRRA
jgi:drug/metabolite transporter (DMT)-like permease